MKNHLKRFSSLEVFKMTLISGFNCFYIIYNMFLGTVTNPTFCHFLKFQRFQ